MHLGRWTLLLALALPAAAQETPHPNRLAWLSIFPEPLPEGVDQISLEASNQWLREDRRDSQVTDTHADLHAEDWTLVSDYATGLGPGRFNIRTRLTYRSSGVLGRVIMNWHDILGVDQAGRDLAPCFEDVYHLERNGVTVFDLNRPRAELQGVDLAYVQPWGSASEGGRVGGSVQLPTGHVEELQSSGGTNFLAVLAGWRTFGAFHVWA